MTNVAAPIGLSAAGTLQPEAIERTLRDLWREIAAQDATAMQVRTLNLLVYVPKGSNNALRQAISAVAVQHPGRTITLEPLDEPAMAEATIACRVGGSAHSCGEQIILRGGGQGEALHSLALSLLQPGLPAALWWHGTPPFDQHPFEPLAEAVDLVFVDSRTWDEPSAPLAMFANVRQRYQGIVRYSDLQWVALTAWRQLIAQAFDSPMARMMLPQITNVELRYGGRQHIIGVLLFVGWLMSRLGWRLKGVEPRQDNDAIVLSLRAGDQDLTVNIRQGDGDDGLSQVVLAIAGDQAAEVMCQASSDARYVATSIVLPSAPPLQRVTSLKRLAMADLIAEELAQAKEDEVYTAALALAIQLTNTLGRWI